MRLSTRVCLVAGVALAVLAARTSWAQESKATTTETKKFEVVSVDGNKVVVKDAAGAARELTVPADFKFTVDGKDVGVDQLKPGMTGTATITTTTTSTPVYVTEVREGEVMQATGNSITVRTRSGYRMFSEADVQKRNAKLMRDGKPLNFADIHTGDHLTAVIVTEHPPKVVTEREVIASMTTPPPPPQPATPPAAAQTPPPTPKTTTPPPTPEERKQLPTTATDRPLVAAIGAMSLVLAALVAMRRRRNAAH